MCSGGGDDDARARADDDGKSDADGDNASFLRAKKSGVASRSSTSDAPRAVAVAPAKAWRRGDALSDGAARSDGDSGARADGA
jgi:hypothetical protein